MERKQTEMLFRWYGTMDVDEHVAGHSWFDSRNETKGKNGDYGADWKRQGKSVGNFREPIQDPGGNSRRVQHEHGRIGAGF